MEAGRGTTSRQDSLLHHHDFRLFWLGQTVGRFGSSVSTVAVPLVAVSTLDAAPLLLGLLHAAAWLPWLVIGLPAGAWVDRWPRRPVMLTANAIAMLCLLSIPLAAVLSRLTTAHLLTAILLVGTTTVFFETAGGAYLPSLVDKDRRQEANAKLQGTTAAAQVVGPGAGGLIAQLFSPVTGILADVVGYATSFLCLARIDHRENVTPKAATEDRSLYREIMSGKRFVVSDPYLRVFTAYSAVCNLATAGLASMFVAFLVREAGVPIGITGVVLAATSIGGVLGAVVAGRVTRRFGTAHGMLVCVMTTMPFGLLMPLAANGPSLSLAVIGGLMVNAGVISGSVIRSSFRQNYTPAELMGRVTVTMQFLNYGAIPLGALTAGALATSSGIRTTMWVMTTLLALSALILLIGPAKSARDLPDHPRAVQP
ncbi:MFS transporter [Lentzea sp. NPDC059081]|uniref:MFS transporter n=1 Tax=Lentzea sp. NPDC059081 TaxID=3346719 RepID=UPI0036C260DF